MCVDTHTLNWWKQQARIEITAVLGNRNSWYYHGKDAKQLEALQPAFTKRGVRGFASDIAPRKCEYFCQGVMNVSLEDIAYALYCDETADQHSLASHIPPGLVAAPELVYFEFSCKTRDADGQVVLMQYITSPEFASEQFEEHNIGLARARMGMIASFRILEEGTHCQTFGWFESGPSAPAWVATKAAQQVFSNMNRLVGLADARAIDRLGAASSVSASKTCYLCNKKFGLLRKRRYCRSCGQSICVKCTIKLRVLSKPAVQLPLQAPYKQRDSANASSNGAPRFVDDRFCLPCVLHAREQRLQSGSLSDDVGHSLSSDATAPSSSLDDERRGINLSDLHDVIDELDGLGGSNRQYTQDPRRLSPASARGRANSTTAENISATGSSRKKYATPVELYLAQAKKNGEPTGRKQGKRTPTYPFTAAEVEQEKRDSSCGGRERRHSPRRHGKRASSRDKARQPQRRLPPRVDELGWSPGNAEQSYVERSTASARSRRSHQPVYADLSTLEEKAPASLHGQPQQKPAPLPEAFSRLRQSIAAQEALLMTIQHERQKFHSRRRQSSDITDPVDDDRLNSARFEVVSEAY
ncbi:hypothetical protein PybrP1_010107 [[Pythium] brassicae (nom. inval.)]|nr:hypothetical protein PybrP1_010107 [[Pythium] brassicae (nom. inval.)]